MTSSVPPAVVAGLLVIGGTLFAASQSAFASAGTAVYFVHTNYLGTPQTLTNESGAVAWEADYEPFGDVIETVSTVSNNLRFPGQYFDAETGLHYNYFRDYNPSTGRYIESDLIGLGGGINTYAYVGGNPIRFDDRFGLESFDGGDLGSLVRGGPVSFGITGTLANVTMGGTISGDNLAGINVLPEASLLFLMCEKPPNNCVQKKRQIAPVDISITPGRLRGFLDFLFVGFIVRADGTQCVTFGPSAGLPINFGLSGERPLFPNDTRLNRPRFPGRAR